mmetsp:Transcript_2475/g.3519  ORF Transcript_2475/g.3519 Transcript_2475/m.3519 type:complete len:244 (+) Transcript_2475:605-1336(+)
MALFSTNSSKFGRGLIDALFLEVDALFLEDGLLFRLLPREVIRLLPGLSSPNRITALSVYLFVCSLKACTRISSVSSSPLLLLLEVVSASSPEAFSIGRSFLHQQRQLISTTHVSNMSTLILLESLSFPLLPCSLFGDPSDGILTPTGLIEGRLKLLFFLCSTGDFPGLRLFLEFWRLSARTRSERLPVTFWPGLLRVSSCGEGSSSSLTTSSSWMFVIIHSPIGSKVFSAKTLLYCSPLCSL